MLSAPSDAQSGATPAGPRPVRPDGGWSRRGSDDAPAHPADGDGSVRGVRVSPIAIDAHGVGNASPRTWPPPGGSRRARGAPGGGRLPGTAPSRMSPGPADGRQRRPTWEDAARGGLGQQPFPSGDVPVDAFPRLISAGSSIRPVSCRGTRPPVRPGSAPVPAVLPAVLTVVPAVLAPVAAAVDPVGDDRCRADDSRCTSDGGADHPASSSAHGAEGHLTLLPRRLRSRPGWPGSECVRWR